MSKTFYDNKNADRYLGDRRMANKNDITLREKVRIFLQLVSQYSKRSNKLDVIGTNNLLVWGTLNSHGHV